MRQNKFCLATVYNLQQSAPSVSLQVSVAESAHKSIAKGVIKGAIYSAYLEKNFQMWVFLAIHLALFTCLYQPAESYCATKIDCQSAVSIRF